MSLIRRAFLYLTRKRVKTISLFVIVLVITTLALSSVSLKDAVETAQLNVRQSLGGCLIVEPNYDKTENWEADTIMEGTIPVMNFTGMRPTKELAETIEQELDGLQGYNLSGSDLVRLFKAPDGNPQNGYDLSHIAVGTSTYDAKFMAEAKESGFAHSDVFTTYNVSVCTDSSFDYYFMNNEVRLVEGRHIDENETGVVMINEKLAEFNDLKVGDTIYIRDSNIDLHEKGMTEAVFASVEIVGLFEVVKEYPVEFSYRAPENMIFITAGTREIYDVRYEETTSPFKSIYFYAEEPDDLDHMIEQVQALPGFEEGGDFVVTVRNEALNAIKGPLQNIGQIVTILIVLILVVGVIILSLVLSARTKERVRETGILLSVGVKKTNILLQYLVEMTVIVLLACTVSVFSSMLVAENAGTMILQDTVNSGIESYTQQLDEEERVNNADVAAEETQNLTKLTVSIGAGEIAVLYAGGLLLAWIAVAASSVPLFRLKPREILSKMS